MIRRFCSAVTGIRRSMLIRRCGSFGGLAICVTVAIFSRKIQLPSFNVVITIIQLSCSERMNTRITTVEARATTGRRNPRDAGNRASRRPVLRPESVRQAASFRADGRWAVDVLVSRFRDAAAPVQAHSRRPVASGIRPRRPPLSQDPGRVPRRSSTFDPTRKTGPFTICRTGSRPKRITSRALLAGTCATTAARPEGWQQGRTADPAAV